MQNKKSVIGHANCPTCGYADAEIKEDKNGAAFLFCPDCATQVFTRNQHRDHCMRKNMRAVIAVTVTVTEPTTPEPQEPQASAAKQAAPIQAPAPAAKTAPAAVKPRSASWLQPILAGDK